MEDKESGTIPDPEILKTIFHECRQCGACCKSYRKIVLRADEVEFIKKMGGHVGTDIQLRSLLHTSLEELIRQAKKSGKIFMIHPDDKGCVFLQKRNNKYYCGIYNYRPQTCKGFTCSFADSSFMKIFGEDAIHLLGQDKFGRKEK